MPGIFDCSTSMRDNDLLICIDSYNNRLMEGHLFTKDFSGSRRFDNMVQLLRLIQSTLDKLGYPEPYTQIKDFSNSGKAGESETMDFFDADTCERYGKLATFHVKIIFRQNASWQGVITWAEDRREESFRSALELVFLMDSALASDIKCYD